MSQPEELEQECVKAFMQLGIEGNKQDAERLLPQVRQTAKFSTNNCGNFYLLHYAARHGWVNVVTELATKYNCDVNCKDDEGDTPLYWAGTIVLLATERSR